MKKISLLILFVVSFSYLYSQKIEVKSSIDNNKIIIGDWIKLNLKATHSNDIHVNWPKLEDVLGKFEVVKRDSFPKIEDINGEKIESLSAFISIYDSGYYQIPAIPFEYSSLSDSSKKLISTEPINISVNTLAVDTTLPIKDAKDVMDIPIPIMEILSYIAVVLFIFMLGYAIWEHYHRKRLGKAALKPVPLIPPYELAMSELTALNEKKLWQRGMIKEYYTEVTEIIRRYIERRYGISALEMTSSEIVNSLINVQHDAKIQEILNMFLNLADYVKFAKFQPNTIDNEDELKRAYSFIENTKIIEEMKETGSSSESDIEKQEK
jgi:hypothetical protein